MRLGRVIEKTANGSEIRKAETRDGVRYFAWAPDATVGQPFTFLASAREALGIDTAPKKAA